MTPPYDSPPLVSVVNKTYKCEPARRRFMAFQRWGYDFDGAYTSPDSLQPRSGVYVIWCRNGENWSVLDVGEHTPHSPHLQEDGSRVLWVIPEMCHEASRR